MKSSQDHRINYVIILCDKVTLIGLTMFTPRQLVIRLSRRLFGPYFKNVDPDTAMKYTNIFRMVYFFSATSIFFLLLSTKGEVEDSAKRKLMGVQDFSDAHKSLRLRQDNDEILIFDYKYKDGMVSKKWTKEEYLRALEDDALERAKETQRKLLAEGKEIPPGVIKLV